MPVKLRLQRKGRSKAPFYHIVAADSRSPRDGRFIEKLGTYNPLLPRDHAQRLTLDKERIAHWLKVGAQPSDRVARFLAQAEMMKPRERREQSKKPLPRAKAQERMKAFDKNNDGTIDDTERQAMMEEFRQRGGPGMMFGGGGPGGNGGPGGGPGGGRGGRGGQGGGRGGNGGQSPN